jgi:ATP-dependent helicase/nuclease subunit A
MTPPVPLVDGEARRKAASDLDTSFCVEAGAGTGKTTILVDRFASIVESGRAPCTKIVAITFTEKAAGEMKIRLRSKLRERLKEEGLDEAARANLEAAVVDLERAPISTIHSFAATILREFPIEAGIDPDFRQLDALESSLLFDECWDDFLAVAADEWGEVLGRFMAFGGSIDDLRSMAAELYDRRAERSCERLFEEDSAPAARAHVRDDGAPPWSPSALREAFARAAERLSILVRECCICADDRGREAIATFIERTRGLDRLANEELEYLLLALPLPKNKGNKENWRPAEACVEQKDIFQRLAELQRAEKKRLADEVRARLEELFEGFLASVERRKSDERFLDFDDLLIRTRELCKNADALKRIRERYRYILVDEFQDTDPVQAEIVYLLGGDPSAGDRLGLEPGKLFIVGDPKQSIYRFRKADIETYDRVRRTLSSRGELVAITENFRSVPGIIEWVNDTFSPIMRASDTGAFQPRYEAIHPYRPPTASPSIAALDLELGDQRASADVVRRREGEAIARLIHRLLDDKFPVRDAETKEMRAVEYGDIAVLYPGTTGIDHYEEPLRAENIPYIVEGGKLFYAREEIRDLSSAIWAIEDPYDALALVGCLRSPMFGFSDEELLLFKRNGGRFNYLDPGPGLREASPDLAAAFGLLAELHGGRGELGPARTVRELLHRTNYLELSALRPHGEQRVSNIRKAVSSARAFEGKTHSFRRFARWFRDQEMLASAESESPIVEEGEKAVRLLTVHKAKGLQFPVVVLANLIQVKRTSSQIIVERGRNLSFNLGAGFETSDHEALLDREKRLEAAETIRLLYVAGTRAGDLLVIPRMPKEGSYFDLIKACLPEAGSEHEGARRYGEVWTLSKLPPPRGESRPFVRLEKRSREDLARAADERTSWIEARNDLLARAARAPLVLAPSRLAEEAVVGTLAASARGGKGTSGALVPPKLAGKAEGGLGDAETCTTEDRAVLARDRSRAFGRAFHRMMELADLSAASLPSDLAAAIAAQFGIREEAGELERCAASAIASHIVRRAARARQLFREVPFALGTGGHFLEGRIDLLFEEAGGWVLVDYKTDERRAEGNELGAYLLQAGIYALALERFGIACRDIVLYFARSNEQVAIEFSPELRARAERSIREASPTVGNGRGR